MVLFALAGCGGNSEEVTISAASSLTEVAEALETQLEADHPDLDITLNLGGSAGLVAQIRQGAPVDILLAADDQALVPDDPLVLESAALATNQIVIVTPTDRPLTLDQLADPSLRIVACDPTVPCGRLAQHMLDTIPLAPLELEPDSLEQNVRLVRQRILSGEADAGFIYRTDADIEGLQILDLGLGVDAYRNTVTASRLTDTPARLDVMRSLTETDTFSSIAERLGFGTP